MPVGINGGINAISGGVAGRFKTAGKLAQFGVNYATDVGLNTATDVGFYGQDFGTSLATNSVMQLGGQAVGAGLGYGFKGLKAGYSRYGQYLNPRNYSLDLPTSGRSVTLGMNRLPIRYKGSGTSVTEPISDFQHFKRFARQL